jgi:Protein of unknown function (DUF1501)
MAAFDRISRRDFGAWLLASSALALGPRLARARTSVPPVTPVKMPRRAGSGPSKFLVIFLEGGRDDLYSVDPKEPSEVRPGIFPVYAASDLSTRGSLRLAPPWACLAPYMAQMQVVVGIQSNTVAHDTGIAQVHQMRRNIAAMNETNFITRVGESLAPDATLHSIHINVGGGGGVPSAGREFFDDSGDCGILTKLHRIANDDALRDTARHALASALKTSCQGDACDSFRIVDLLLQKMQGTPVPAPLPGSPGFSPAEQRSLEPDGTRTTGLEFSWAHYALAHDLAPAVFLSPTGDWDTHANNTVQRLRNHEFAVRLQHLLDGLAAVRRPDGKTLLDEVGIVILSELGRYPYLNPFEGKDHFPQISAVLFGPGLKAGRFGETGPEILGTEVSFSSGLPGSAGSLLTLDDLGRTLLEWVGHPDPAGLGYDGRVMEFCFA